MSDYNKYVLAVNTIFEGIEKMKTNWTNQDNINYIETIEEYRQIVIDEVNRRLPHNFLMLPGSTKLRSKTTSFLLSLSFRVIPISTT